MLLTPDAPSDEPTDADFETALDLARHGEARTEWAFPDEVLAALLDVAYRGPQRALVDTARAAWAARD